MVIFIFFFFFNDTATTEIYTLSLHDALPILKRAPVPASSAERCMQDTHRTGAVSWSASRRRARVASRTGSAVALAITGNAGGWNGACSSVTRRWFAAGAMRDEWNAPLTLSGTTRLAPRALHAAPAFATASGSPEITVWSGAFRFAATTTAPPLDAARHEIGRAHV